MPRRLTALALSLWLLLLGQAALAGEPRSHRLANGLEVVIQPLQRSPVVAIQVWVKAGSRLEEPAERGITHQIEHMIFKGTPRRGLGQVAGQIEAAGGEINAYTSLDHTVYHTLLPAESWRLGLDVLADAVKNSLFDAAELNREKQVVLEEWRRSQDNPHNRLIRELFATAFVRSPYRHPVIGYSETIEKFNRRLILDYINKWYTADKMTLVVVGAIDPDQVLAEARKDFSDIPAGPRASFSPPDEPVQTDLRFKVVHDRVKQAYVALSFRMPGLGSPDVAAYDLLSELLGGNDSSRLQERIWAQKGLVNSLNVSSFTPLDEGLFLITARLDQTKLEPALRAIWTELAAAAGGLFSPQELSRARLAFTADFLRSKETMQGEAGKLGFFASLMGSTDKEAAYLSRIESLSAEELRRVAAKTFRPEGLSLVVMLPEGAAPPQESLIRSVFQPLPPSRADRAAPGQVSRFELPGGGKLLVQEDHSLPLLAMRAVFEGGLLGEPAENAGAFRLLAGCWTRGAAGLTAQDLARRVDDMAGQLNAFSGRNSFGLAGSFLSRFTTQGTDLFCRVLLNPDFPADEVAKRRDDQLAAIRAQEERPEVLAFRLFRQAAYQGHPYSRDELGLEETVARLRPEDLRRLHQRFVRAENLVLAVVGDVDPAEIHQRLSELLAPLARGYQPLRVADPEPLPQGGLSRSQTRPGLNQVQTLFGFRAPGLEDPDNQALDVLAQALAGQSGRLFVELRDKKSLAYAVTAFNSAGVGLGSFVFYLASAPEKAAQVRQELEAQMAQVRADKLSQEEMAKAKAQLTAEWILNRQSLDERAMQLALYERLGLGYDYPARYTERLKALTAADVLETVRRRLDASRPIWVTVGPGG